MDETVLMEVETDLRCFVRSRNPQALQPWQVYWWNDVSHICGLRGRGVVADVDIGAFVRESIIVFEYPTELIRAAYRVLALLERDRALEERIFGNYRAVLENRLYQLGLRLRETIDTANNVVARADEIREVCDHWGYLAEKTRGNVLTVSQCAAGIKDRCCAILPLIQQPENQENLIAELRACFESATGRWGNWQRRLQNGGIGAAFAATALFLSSWYYHSMAFFSVVPFSNWLIANTYRILLGGISSYILVGALISGRFSRLKSRMSAVLIWPTSDVAYDDYHQRFMDSVAALERYLSVHRSACRTTESNVNLTLRWIAPAVGLVALSMLYNAYVTERVEMIGSNAGVLCDTRAAGRIVFTSPGMTVLRNDSLSSPHFESFRLEQFYGHVSEEIAQGLPLCDSLSKIIEPDSLSSLLSKREADQLIARLSAAREDLMGPTRIAQQVIERMQSAQSSEVRLEETMNLSTAAFNSAANRLTTSMAAFSLQLPELHKASASSLSFASLDKAVSALTVEARYANCMQKVDIEKRLLGGLLGPSKTLDRRLNDCLDDLKRERAANDKDGG